MAMYGESRCYLAMNEFTQEQLDQFTDVMVKKAVMHGFVDGIYGWNGDDCTAREAFRGMLQNVIVDTELALTRRVPLEEWLSNEN